MIYKKWQSNILHLRLQIYSKSYNIHTCFPIIASNLNLPYYPETRSAVVLTIIVHPRLNISVIELSVTR